MARKSEVTPEMLERVLRARRKGVSVTGCAKYAGLCLDVLFRMIEKKSEFSEAWRRAEGENEYELVDRIQQQSPGWQAAAWLLSRSRPADWSEHVIQESNQAPITLQIVQDQTP